MKQESTYIQDQKKLIAQNRLAVTQSAEQSQKIHKIKMPDQLQKAGDALWNNLNASDKESVTEFTNLFVKALGLTPKRSDPAKKKVKKARIPRNKI